jgi:hypothetical protein
VTAALFALFLRELVAWAMAGQKAFGAFGYVCGGEFAAGWLHFTFPCGEYRSGVSLSCSLPFGVATSMPAMSKTSSPEGFSKSPSSRKKQ